MKELRIILQLAKEIGFVKTSVILLIALGIVGGGSFWLGKSNSITNISQVVGAASSETASAYSALADSEIPNKNVCEVKKFSDHEEDWLFNEFKKDGEGYYCPKWNSGFLSPDMWYRNDINADFAKIRFVYEVKNNDSKQIEPASFIFSFGESPRLMRVYIPERNPQLIGSESIVLSSSTDGLVRQDPYELRDPVKENTQAELTVRSVVVKENDVSYLYNLNYISDQSGKSIEDSFSRELQLPIPNLGAATVRFGVGTFKGSCIKPIEYEICK